jgi:hypothetical protein
MGSGSSFFLIFGSSSECQRKWETGKVTEDEAGGDAREGRVNSRAKPLIDVYNQYR